MEAGRNGARNGESLAAIRVWNGAASYEDSSPMIVPDFRGGSLAIMCLPNGPVFVS